ncbi:MAG: GNAT family N-acetyltransferase [Candidatus Doudnabacteria bacterium]|nr:GNAT family N-acetyltransferase [Candidatus Doudnabacteria bacterium]
MDNSLFEQKVLDVYHELRQQPSLAPSPTTNKLFSGLVSLALTEEANQYQEFPDAIQRVLPEIHTLASLGEYELEKHWAERVVASAFPVIALEQYPYFHNYEQLTQLEYQSLKVLGERRLARCLFVGSGPLPLSAILLARTFGTRVTCMDKAAEAVSLSARVLEAIDLTQIVDVVQADIFEAANLHEFDVIFLGALVGMTEEEKQKIIQHVFTHCAVGSLIVIRTAHQGRRLLYPAYDERRLPGFSLQAVIEPKNEIVNSIILAEKPLLGALDVQVRDKHDAQVYKDFRSFTLQHISESYKMHYNPLWHHDIDQAEAVYSKPNSAVFVAYAGGEVVGTIAVRAFDLKNRELQKRYAGKTVAAIWRYFISPKYSHTTVGAVLHEHAQNFAHANGYQVLYAHDQTFVSGAIRKYVSQGYVPVRDEHDQWGTIHLEKNL